MHKRIPMPGDAVIFINNDRTKPAPCWLGIVEGEVGQPEAEFDIIFNFSAYRDSRVVSCSGGPGSILTSAVDLIDTGLTLKVEFWRWKEGETRQSEKYTLDVPLFWWGGDKWFCGADAKSVKEYNLDEVISVLTTLKKSYKKEASMAHIVELEPKVWLADGEGDPARTLKEEHAAKFKTHKEAENALEKARTFRPFARARITETEA